MTKQKRIQPLPGDVFAVPLGRGGYGLALIARSVDVGVSCNMVLCYGFQNLYDSVPGSSVLCQLGFADTVEVLNCGDMNVRRGVWPIVGRLPRFEPADWPVPPEIRPAYIDGRSQRDPTASRLEVTEDVFLCSANIPNDGIVRPKDADQFPCAVGLGDSAFLALSLDMAVRDKFPLHYVRVKSGTKELWLRTIEECKRRGVYPRAVNPLRRRRRPARKKRPGKKK